MKPSSRFTPPRIAGLLLLVGGFSAGWATANLSFATRVNTGLVRAFNSVGQNLFGSAVFGVDRLAPTDPCDEADCVEGVQLDLADDVRFPVKVNLFHPPNPILPPNPCQVYAQLQFGPAGVKILYDPGAEGAVLPEEVALDNVVPSLARCAN